MSVEVIVSIAAIVVGIVVAVLVPALGWLVVEVINQRSKLEAIQTAVDERGEMREKIEESLRDIGNTTSATNAQTAALLERTLQFQRTLDRHERWLEEGRR